MRQIVSYSHRVSAKPQNSAAQSLSQKSEIFASSLYTREPWALPRQCDKLQFTQRKRHQIFHKNKPEYKEKTYG